MKKRAAMLACVLALMLSLGTVTAFAEEAVSEEPAASYSFTAGQQRSRRRNELYAQASEIESEEERNAFLAENGIADTEWSEEAAANFCYAAGRLRGASFRSDDSNDNENSNMSSYNFVTGQQRGSGYQK
ncbi:MAG: hypothetical protein ACI4SJ_02300 [Candidatus Avispirillum sp.]